MSVTQIQWTPFGASDIHLVPGFTSPRLDQLLRVFDTDEHWFRADRPPSGVTFDLEFDANFKGDAGDHGFTFDEDTGEVAVPFTAASAAAPWLTSFIVTAFVTQTDEDDPDHPTVLRARIRFFIHREIKARWLTPSQLTVRQDASNMRFSVLARFEDGSIGDISNWSPLTAPDSGDVTFVRRFGSADPAHIWSPKRGDPSTAMYVDPVTGVIGCDDPAATVKVEVQIDLGNPLASAHAIGAPAWSTPTNVSWVAGPGKNAMFDKGVHNVLILPDGFVDSPGDTDRLAFEAYVRELVHDLSTNSQTRPYDICSSVLNYFTAWVPSPQPGATVLHEVFSKHPTATPIVGEDAELPLRPRPDPLTVAGMIGAVGPPAPVSDPATATLDAARLQLWQQLYDDVPPDAELAAIFPDWLAGRTRTLVNELDTAFHTADDYRPRADRAGVGTSDVSFHPLRLTRADFDVFLQALRDEDGNQPTRADGTPRPMPWAESERDSNFVVIARRSTRDGGTNNPRGLGRYVVLTMGGDDTVSYLDNPDGNGVDMVPDPIPARVAIGPWSTFAHEVAHSMSIGDEYGGLGQLPESLVEDVQESPNLQEQDALLDDDSKLSAANIKWRWPRISVAGVLRDPAPDVESCREDPATPGQYLLSLGFGQGYDFTGVPIVALRGEGLVGHPQTSGRLRVIAVNLDELTVAPLDGVDFDPDDFTDGDIVMTTVRETDPDPANLRFGTDLSLVHPRVIGQINATQNPLNAAHGAPLNRPCPGEAPIPTPATNLDHDIMDAQPRLSYQVVGLYENGHGYDIGIYRPSGMCIMAGTTMRVDPNTDIVIDNDPDGNRRIPGFCPVCRYAMVDALDPSRHGLLDADYAQEYPK